MKSWWRMISCLKKKTYHKPYNNSRLFAFCGTPSIFKIWYGFNLNPKSYQTKRKYLQFGLWITIQILLYNPIITFIFGLYITFQILLYILRSWYRRLLSTYRPVPYNNLIKQNWKINANKKSLAWKSRQCYIFAWNPCSDYWLRLVIDTSLKSEQWLT